MRSKNKAVPRRRRGWACLLLLVLGVAGCRGTPTSLPTPTPAAPPPTASLTTASPPRPAPTATPAAARPDGIVVGAQVAPEDAKELCDGLKQDGARATVLWVRWGDVQKSGQYLWDALDSQVDQLRACGLEVAVHIQARQKQMEPSSMPADLQSYTGFVSALVGHLKGRVRRYAIENEAMSGFLWSGSPEEYFRLLDVAYPAIKAADPQALVLDSGPSSAALGIMRAYSLFQQGDRAQALALVQESLAESGGEILLPSPRAETDLERFFQARRAKIIVDWMPQLAAHQSSFDVVQFHWYGSWDRIPDLIAWIRGQGIDKPMEAWELGRHYADSAAFSEAVHAQEMARTLAVAAGEGCGLVIQFPFVARPQRNLPGLYTDRGPRPADTAFRVVATHLNGAWSPSRLDLGPKVWAYRFNTATGDLYVLWTSEGETTVSLPVDATTVTVTTIDGSSMNADPARLPVSVSPIFVGQ